MATNLNTGGIRPVTLPNQIPPMPAVARILSRFDRVQLHGFIAVAIDLADALDGDIDLEEDDPSGQCDDDGINTDLSAQWACGAGCELSDPDSSVDDRGCDPDEGV